MFIDLSKLKTKMLRIPTEVRATPSLEWSLTIANTNETDNSKGRKTIWTGRIGTCPTQAILSDIIEDDLGIESLQDLSAQICKYAPFQSIPPLLSCLSCNYWRVPRPKLPPGIDVKQLQTLADLDERAICGKVFLQGDIVWTCRQCAKDPTCVQCDQCFRKADHIGHEVYFHRASGGGSGCCDCGDEEAWCKSGNCLDHNHPSRDNNVQKNPLDSVPEDLQKGTRAVVKGAMGVVVSYIISTVRGFAPYNSNIFVEEATIRTEPLVVRLHNDDVHSYDQVIAALRTYGLTIAASEEITKKVDKEGEAVVATENLSGASKLQQAHQQFSLAAGLLVSYLPQSLTNLEPRIVSVFDWVLSMGMLSGGLRRILVEEMIVELASSAHCFPDSMDPALQALNQHHTAQNAFDCANQFPSQMLHLSTLPSNPLETPVYHTPSAMADGATIGDRANITDYAEDFTRRLQHPFERCHCDALSLMLVGSPYLSVTLKKNINDLIIQFQHDLVFKASFSQQFSTLYPSLCVLYCRNIGTSDRTVFHTSVQVYTANSVVSMMSSDGAGTSLRLLPEGDRPVMITPLLAATLQIVLLDTGCLPPRTLPSSITTGADERFLAHHSIRTHRLSHLMRDLEYLTADNTFCTRLIAEDVDIGMVDIWVEVSTMLQNIDSYTRKADVHVEREDDHWQDAANLVLEFEAVSGNFISRALLDQPFSEQRMEVASRSRSDSISNAPSYVAPTINHYDEVQLAVLRQHAVELCTAKFLKALSKWVRSQTGVSGTLSDTARTVFLSHPTSEYYCVQQEGPIRQLTDLLGVSSLPISVHLPLHRLFAKLVYYAAAGGVQLTSVVETLKSVSPLQTNRFAEHSLRCLVFASQVNIGMWRRNGYTAANLAYNYGRAPLSKTLRDMDIVTAQLSIFALGGDAFIATITSRYELLNYLTAVNDHSFRRKYLSAETWSRIPSSIDIREYMPALLAEMLRFLILAMTYTPVCLLESTTDSIREGWNRVLKREIIHQLLGGATSSGHLQKLKIMVGSTRTISDVMLQAIIEETCIRRNDDDEANRLLSLKPESLHIFDPEFPNLSNQQQATACDRRREHIKSISQNKTEFIPLISQDTIPIIHHDLKDIRAVLYCPSIFTVLQCAVESTLIDWGNNTTSSSNLTILSRVVHLATLQIQCAMLAPASFTASFFNDTFSAASVTTTTACTAPEAWTIAPGCGRGLLKALAGVWVAGTLRDDVLYHQGLGWVLQQISLQSEAGKVLLATLDVKLNETATKSTALSASADSVSGLEVDNSPAAKLQRQKAAQQRALQEANKRAAAAMAAFAEEMSEDEEDEENDPTDLNKTSMKGTSIEKTAAEDSTLECIICREKKSVPLGYLCFLQPSNVLRNAHLSCPDCPDLTTVYRVVALHGCKVYTEQTEESEVVKILPQGEHIRTESSEGRWVNIISPVRGWCNLYCNTENQANSHAGTTGGKVTVNLHPVADLQFNKHGGTRLHASVCGHTMHFDCWDMFYAANYARHESSIRAADLQAVDIARGESLCPLCKSVTNTLLPHVSSGAVAGVREAPLLPTQSPAFCSSPNNQTTRQSELNSYTGGLAEVTQTASMEEFKKSLHDAFIQVPERGKLSNDQMFYSSCNQQFRMVWEADQSDISASRNITVLRQLHALWSTTAYTLLGAVCLNIRERSTANYPVESTTTTYQTLQLPESDNIALRHLLEVVWRSSSALKHFNSFVVQPMRDLILGISSSTVQVKGSISDSPTEHFLTHGSADRNSLLRSLLSMPFESVSTSCFPNSHTVRRLGKLAMEKGLPEQDIWPFLKTPLLSHDLHIIAVAVFSCTEDLHSFLIMNQFLCVAKLAQCLLEPAATGVIDLLSGSVASVKAGVKSEGKHTHVSGESEKGSVHKRFRTASSDTPDASFSSSGSGLATQQLDFTPGCAGIKGISLADPTSIIAKCFVSLRSTVCSAAGTPLLAAAPVGPDLVALVLDSWIPYLEFAFQLQSHAQRLCGVEPSQEALSLPPNLAATNCHLQNDSGHQNLLAKFTHAEALMRALQLPALDIDNTNGILPAFLVDAMSMWGQQYNDAQEIIVAADRPGTLAKPHAWIPPVPPANSVPPPKHPASPRSPPYKSHNRNREEPVSGERTASPLRSPAQSAYDMSLLATMDMVLGDGRQQRELDRREAQPDDQDDDSFEGAMEEQIFAGLGDDFLDMDGAVDDDIEGTDQDGSIGGSDSDSSGEDHYFAPEEGIEEADFIEAIAMDEGWLGLTQDGTGITTTGAEHSGSRSKSNELQWKLQGVYPINPTVDFPSPDLNALVQAAASAEGYSTSSYMLLMPARAPLQGSVTGSEAMVGYNGTPLRYLYPDLSHMGLGMRHLRQIFVPLPTMYTDLYQMAKFVSNDANGKPVDDPAICLLCGRILNAGNKASHSTFDSGAGECTLHARSCGAGTGVFFLVQQCQSLLIRGSRSTYSPSLYVDASGEVNEHRGQNRPLFLNAKRYKKLEELYIHHQIAKEVVRKRATAESVIRMNWF